MPCPRTQCHFSRPGIEPATFWLKAQFLNHSAIWPPGILVDIGSKVVKDGQTCSKRFNGNLSTRAHVQRAHGDCDWSQHFLSATRRWRQWTEIFYPSMTVLTKNSNSLEFVWFIDLYTVDTASLLFKDCVPIQFYDKCSMAHWGKREHEMDRAIFPVLAHTVLCRTVVRLAPSSQTRLHLAVYVILCDNRSRACELRHCSRVRKLSEWGINQIKN